jgi:hypothetical protein
MFLGPNLTLCRAYATTLFSFDKPATTTYLIKIILINIYIYFKEILIKKQMQTLNKSIKKDTRIIWYRIFDFLFIQKIKTTKSGLYLIDKTAEKNKKNKHTAFFHIHNKKKIRKHVEPVDGIK